MKIYFGLFCLLPFNMVNSVVPLLWWVDQLPVIRVDFFRLIAERARRQELENALLALPKGTSNIYIGLMEREMGCKRSLLNENRRIKRLRGK